MLCLWHIWLFTSPPPQRSSGSDLKSCSGKKLKSSSVGIPVRCLLCTLFVPGLFPCHLSPLPPDGAALLEGDMALGCGGLQSHSCPAKKHRNPFAGREKREGKEEERERGGKTEREACRVTVLSGTVQHCWARYPAWVLPLTISSPKPAGLPPAGRAGQKPGPCSTRMGPQLFLPDRLPEGWCRGCPHGAIMVARSSSGCSCPVRAVRAPA